MATRREILAAMLPVAAMTQKLETSTGAIVYSFMEPLSITMALGSYKEFVFTLGDERVTFTPTQVMAILRGEPVARESDGDPR